MERNLAYWKGRVVDCEQMAKTCAFEDFHDYFAAYRFAKHKVAQIERQVLKGAEK